MSGIIFTAVKKLTKNPRTVPFNRIDVGISHLTSYILPLIVQLIQCYCRINSREELLIPPEKRRFNGHFVHLFIHFGMNGHQDVVFLGLTWCFQAPSESEWVWGGFCTNLTLRGAFDEFTN